MNKLITTVLFITLYISSTVYSDDDDDRAFINVVIPGVASHGANVFNNEQIADHTLLASTLTNQDTREYWENFLLREIGACYPDGGFGGIDETTPLESLMCGWVSPEILETVELLGLSIDDEIVAEQNGRTIADGRQPVDFFSRGFLPHHNDAAFPKELPTRNNVDYTLEQWNQARGSIHIKCHDEHSSKIVVLANNLVPRIPYTLWIVGAVNDLSPWGGVDIGPLWFNQAGGGPGFIIPDEKGRGEMTRNLAFCPFELRNPVFYFALLAHWDNVLWGALPSELITGFNLAQADHVYFPVGDNEYFSLFFEPSLP